MSKKITTQFSFEAPEKEFEIESNITKTVASSYRGAETIWIYVDVDTGLNPQFVSEGDLPDPTTTDRHRSILLDSTDATHVILMDLLSGSRAHESQEVVEYFNQAGDVPLNPNFIFSHVSTAHPCTCEVFDVTKTRIDNDNVIHFAWKSAQGLTKEELLEMIRVHKLRTEELLRDPAIFTNQAASDMYTRFIAVLDYIKNDLIERVEPWKIAVPQVHEL